MEVFDKNDEFTKVFRLQLKELVQELALSDKQIESLLGAFRDTVKVLIDEEADKIWASIRKVATIKDLEDLKEDVKIVKEKVSDEESEELGQQKLINRIILILGGLASAAALIAFLNSEPKTDPRIEELLKKLEATK